MDAQAKEFKTGWNSFKTVLKQVLIGKLWKKLEKATVISNMSYNLFLFWLTMGMILLETVFLDISITFFTEVWCFYLFVFAYTILFISTHNAALTNWVISQWKM